MPRLLHILLHSNEALAKEVITRQESHSENSIVVVDLRAETVDYNQLLLEIFQADSVAVW